MKKKLTKQDLKKTLSELGFKEGQELELPSPSKPNANASSETTEGGESEGGEGDGEGGDGNGSNNPPHKPPFTP